MRYEANSPDDYIAQLPEDRKVPVQKLRDILNKNLPQGFEETISYNMIGYVVPKKTYPKGYHCNPKLPLPFINLASQKNHIALYHSGIYADQSLLDWFIKEHKKYSTQKLDMGKSCIRFKKPEEIPYNVIAALAQKISPKEWIAIYEKIILEKKS